MVIPLYTISIENPQWLVSVIAQGCRQTLGLGLGQSKDMVVVFY